MNTHKRQRGEGLINHQRAQCCKCCKRKAPHDRFQISEEGFVCPTDAAEEKKLKRDVWRPEGIGKWGKWAPFPNPEFGVTVPRTYGGCFACFVWYMCVCVCVSLSYRYSIMYTVVVLPSEGLGNTREPTSCCQRSVNG